ncbi:unnamed protein product [Microthlaspi erraticum]|uniref:FBD domain-containing protein n=1 Tax=Microthlaspi erraticum TaxID=1685480 RepID=A0A6D2IDS5_9BRAS|nr:unnamed protein product [Microthlaspi erraticum]
MLECGGLDTFTCTVSLPRLKLEDIWYDYDPFIVENIIEGSPALKELSVISPSPILVELSKVAVEKDLRVRATTLKIFRLVLEKTRGGKNSSLEIDAPRLVYMSLRDHQSDKMLVKNLSSLFIVEIDSTFNVSSSPFEPVSSSKKYAISDFYVGISVV